MSDSQKDSPFENRRPDDAGIDHGEKRPFDCAIKTLIINAESLTTRGNFGDLCGSISERNRDRLSGRQFRLEEGSSTAWGVRDSVEVLPAGSWRSDRLHVVACQTRPLRDGKRESNYRAIPFVYRVVSFAGWRPKR